MLINASTVKMATQNEIGDLGENIFSVVISRDYTFRARHLGEKWPTSDFYVELIGLKENFYFIVQIKATSQGLNTLNNLKIAVPKTKLHSLNNYYCPTYVAGVDVNTEKVYLIPINTKKRKAISSLSTKFELNKLNRSKLFNDVKSFWLGTGLQGYKSKFKHSI
jgi:hypothetical protein